METPKIIDTGSPEGLVCPGCGVIENYIPKACERRPGGVKQRIMKCQSCGCRFSTIEVAIEVVGKQKRVRIPSDSNLVTQ